jgi:hypothetical protein
MGSLLVVGGGGGATRSLEGAKVAAVGQKECHKYVSWV